MYNNMQLSIGHLTVAIKDREADGETIAICIRRSVFHGIKCCRVEECTYAISTRQKVNRCGAHATEKKLKSSKDCSINIFYLWPEDESGHRSWIRVVNPTK